MDTSNGRPRPARRVLLVEDDALARSLVEQALDDYVVEGVASGEEALVALEKRLYDVVLLDLHLPRMQGLAVLTAATALQTDAQFIVMTGSGSVDAAVEAMKLGACDYLQKPCRAEELRLAVQRACAETELRREVAQLRRRSGGEALSRIVGRSAVMARLFDLIERVAPLRANILITGETGTGKELVARAIHELSGRAHRSFVPVNCSALPETLLESELFGHVRGSFTGAIASRRGLIEEAAGGTLFLDEISTIPLTVQVKLLRVLEERTVQRIGSTQSLPVDFRLIVATNHDLGVLVEDGEFREDLYYRLNVFPLEVPPLRERRGDIPLLASWFRQRFAEENGTEPPAFSAATLARMEAYEWPGNVRELENFVERALILHAGAREVPFEAPTGHHQPHHRLLHDAVERSWSLDRLEREYILHVLEQTNGHRGRAARVLGIDRRTLYRKLLEMGVDLRHETQARPLAGRT